MRCDDSAPRSFVVGVGDRVDLAAPGGLLPRHIAVVAIPTEGEVILRVISLHPDRHLQVIDDAGHRGPASGGVVAVGQVRVAFEEFVLEVQGRAHASTSSQGFHGVLSHLPPGEQLSFFRGAPVRAVGDVVASICGPSAGGFAVPALVADSADATLQGDLVLRTRDGIHELSPRIDELQSGVLIGRSRRCVLGRGFDENDGLSRVHALVMLIDGCVYAFDLASRYGLRDVSRPGKLITSARLDDGAGCLVYGAGHLLFET